MFSGWFDTMNWEAGATMLAVAAASIVGWRQVGVAKRQTELQDLALRRTLFNQRFGVYDGVRKALHETLYGPRIYPDVAGEFRMQVELSRFLFKPVVYERLDQTHKAAWRLWYLVLTPHPRVSARQRELQEEERGALRKWLEDRYAMLPDVFGEELRLSGTEGHSAPKLEHPLPIEWMQHPDSAAFPWEADPN